MKVSKAGEDLMHFFEGYRNKPYRCSAAIWTVGWGHAMYADQLALPNVRKEGYTGLIRSDYQLNQLHYYHPSYYKQYQFECFGYRVTLKLLLKSMQMKLLLKK